MAQPAEQPQLYKPIPRRPFTLDESSSDPSPVDTPVPHPNDFLSPQNQTTQPLEPSKRSVSIKNLTASTLFGIYSSAALDSTPPTTPGSTTRRSSSTNLLSALSSPLFSPASPSSTEFPSDGSVLQSTLSRPLSNLSNPHRKPISKRKRLTRAVGRGILLFLSGAGYGLIIARLHDNGRIAPVKVEVDRYTIGYFFSWGFAAVVLGELLPWVDSVWEDYLWESGASDKNESRVGNTERSNGGSRSVGNGNTEERTNGNAASSSKVLPEGMRGSGEVIPVWNPAIRSIGAFVGIAYAIRKLPWQSTSQASLTLAFVNPVLWYLLDRTRTGFWLSTFVAITGSMFLIGVNPDFVAIPNSPAQLSIFERFKFGGTAAGGVGLDQQEEENINLQFIGVLTWIASVLYVSTLCFGNIGRKLSGR